MVKNFPPLTCYLLHLLWAALIATSWFQNAPAQTCDSGWFGSNCQYKCHCGGGTCGLNGMCSEGVCKRGWFGPGCQFVDLVYTKRVRATPKWLHDRNATTCNQDQSMKQLPVKLLPVFLFNWLRLQVNDPSLLHEFQVTFTDRMNQSTVPCRNMRNATVDETTLDIHCHLDVAVQGVVLEGAGVTSLCSLYISEGRNVALRQNASQSSTYSDVEAGHILDWAAGNAVDGTTNSVSLRKRCTSTDAGDMNPNWTVRLSPAQVINKYVIYNRSNLQNRIKGFILTSFTNDHTVVFNYTDTSYGVYRMYTIIKTRQTAPVSVVTIRANNKVSNPILAICEVELYGDSACPPLKYGPECEHTCNCAVKDEQCFVSTGGCPSGCAAGFQGEGCDRVCDLGKYGLDCSSSCSQFCVATNSSRSPCRPTDGACVIGCVSGYQAPKCEHMVKIVKCDDPIPVAAVVGSLVAVVILVMVVVLGVFLWRQWRSTSRNTLSKVDKGKIYKDAFSLFKMKKKNTILEPID